jgi:glycerol uptake facilitator-like aquaporin
VIFSNFLTGKIIYIEIPLEKNIFQIIYSELFFTGSFFFIILFCCEVTAPSKKSYINCIFIISWFYVIVHAGANISGAAFNPAVLSMMNLFAVLYNIDSVQTNLFRLSMMIIGQLVGVFIFALIYKYLFFKYYLFIKKIQDEKKKIKESNINLI